MTTQEYDVDTINKLYADRDALVEALEACMAEGYNLPISQVRAALEQAKGE